MLNSFDVLLVSLQSIWYMGGKGEKQTYRERNLVC